MNKKNQTRATKRAKGLLDALVLIQEWVNETPHKQMMSFNRWSDDPTRHAVDTVICNLITEAYLKLYRSQALHENERAIAAARGWNMRMFANVTQDPEAIRTESVELVLYGMAFHHMFYNSEQDYWFSPETDAAKDRIKQEYGSAWTQVWYG